MTPELAILTAGQTATSAPSSRFGDCACRTFDVVAAAVLLVLLTPLLVVVGALIKLDSPGPIIFCQRRVGRGLVPFTVRKFRTMRCDASPEVHRAFVLDLIEGHAPERTGPLFKLTGDERVTRAGRFLRRSSLDELPQLWNVLRGEMSLVGPRPAIAYEVERYPAEWLTRFAVKPGITGLWQVSGRSKLTISEMVGLDIEYVRRRSLWLNLVIMIRTIPVVLTARGAS